MFENFNCRLGVISRLGAKRFQRKWAYKVISLRGLTAALVISLVWKRIHDWMRVCANDLAICFASSRQLRSQVNFVLSQSETYWRWRNLPTDAFSQKRFWNFVEPGRFTTQKSLNCIHLKAAVKSQVRKLTFLCLSFFISSILLSIEFIVCNFYHTYKHKCILKSIVNCLAWISDDYVESFLLPQ